MKNKAGKSWKGYVCSKEGFYRFAKMLEIATVTVEAMPQARDDFEGETEAKEGGDKRKVPSSYSFEVHRQWEV